MKNDVLILGAGITGLSAGMNAKADIFEKADIPGGICASYYVGIDGKRLHERDDEESYRFEMGGGHWIFGADKKSLDFINALSPAKSYKRRSSVYLPSIGFHVPYPIQNHLSYLPEKIRKKALAEIITSKKRTVSTLADWLEVSFGRTLCELFFFPFHELYTAGLYTNIAPQDSFKSPVDKALIDQGAKEKTPAVGYNATFIYPERGLDELINKMAEGCRVNYGRKVMRIDLNQKKLFFEDKTYVEYEDAISSLPLNRVLEMAGLDAGKPDPFTSVLVINVGAKKGNRCPEDHWIYIPKNRAGFYRVGFYSNVDVSFLPTSSRKDKDRVSIYVEKAYPGGRRPAMAEIRMLCEGITRELKEWGFISDVEVVDPTWIDVAYTWRYPGSDWVERAVGMLKEHGIFQVGRYGQWKFQGIAESIKDGLNAKRAIRG